MIKQILRSLFWKYPLSIRHHIVSHTLLGLNGIRTKCFGLKRIALKAMMFCLLSMIFSVHSLHACHESALIVPAPTYVYDPATDRTTVTVNFSLGITDFAASPASNVLFTIGGCVGSAAVTSGANISAVIDRDPGAVVGGGGMCTCTAGPYAATTLSWAASVAGNVVTYAYTGFSFGNLCQIACEPNGDINSVGGSAVETDLDGVGVNDAIRNTLVLTVEGFATSVTMSGFESGACGSLLHNNAATIPNAAGTPTTPVNVVCFGESTPAQNTTVNNGAILQTGVEMYYILSGTPTTNGSATLPTSGTGTLIEACDGVGGVNTSVFQTPGYNDVEDPALVFPAPTVTSSNASANTILTNYLYTYIDADANLATLPVSSSSGSMQFILLPDITINGTPIQACNASGQREITLSLQGGYPTPGSPGAGTTYSISGLPTINGTAVVADNASPGNLQSFKLIIPPCTANGTVISFTVTDNALAASTTGPCTKALSVTVSGSCSAPPTGTPSFIQSTCQAPCVLAGGIISIGTLTCPTGATLQYTTDLTGATGWTSVLPSYNQTTAVSFIVRCSCDSGGGTSSSIGAFTTTPGVCTNCPPECNASNGTISPTCP